MTAATGIYDLETVQRDINQRLAAHFKNRVRQAGAIDKAYTDLWSAIKATALAGGKRYRPYLCGLSYTAHGGQDYDQLSLAGCSLELLHTSLLIHDDIIDRDYVRHGQLNISGLYQQKYAAFKNQAEIVHHANTPALLAGDLLISDAYQFLFRMVDKPEVQAPVLDLMHQAVFHAAGGELLDSEAPLLDISEVDSLKIARHKTAVYSFSAPLALGALLAGARDEVIKQWQKIGDYLGVAYQLNDDLLGVFGDSELTGKSNTSDLVQKKHTYLLEQTLALASTEQVSYINQVLNNPNDLPADYDQIKQLMIDLGAKQKVEQEIAANIDKAHHLLAELPLTPNHHAAFDKFINLTTRRVK